MGTNHFTKCGQPDSSAAHGDTEGREAKIGAVLAM